MITLTRQNHTPLFSAVKFAADAVAKDAESTFALTYLYITDKHIIGTDGHRLHISDNDTSITPGYYHVTKNTKTIVSIVLVADQSGFEFPDYEHLLDSCKLDTMEFHHFEYADKFFGDVPYSQLIRSLDDSVTINHSFFINAAQYTDSFAIATTGSLPVIMKGENKMALIMPMQCN